MASEFEYRNDAKVCGRIVYKRPDVNGNLFVVSVSRKTRKKDEHGRRERVFRLINVFFEGAVGKLYDKMYKVGDFVVITGVVQNVHNNLLARDIIKIIGLNMAPKVVGDYENPDMGRANIRGTITENWAISDDLLIVYVKTVIEKRFSNPNPAGFYKEFVNNFVSYTPLGLWRNYEGQHDAKELSTLLSKGTWIDVSCYIETRKANLKSGRILTEQRLYASDADIVGDLQPPTIKTVPDSFFFA